MKGQFFLLGAVLLIVAFYISMPIAQQVSPASELGIVAKNIAGEYARVANFGLNDSTDYMANWSGFVKGRIGYANFTSVWILAVGNGSHVNLTAGNWLGRNITMSVNISGATGSLFVQNEGTNWTSIASGEDCNLTVNWGESRNFTWKRDKANVWVLVNLAKGQDIARNEITG